MGAVTEVLAELSQSPLWERATAVGIGSSRGGGRLGRYGQPRQRPRLA